MKAMKPWAPPPPPHCVPLLPPQPPSLSCAGPAPAVAGCALPLVCVPVPSCVYHQLLEPIPYMFIAIPFPHVAATLKLKPRSAAVVYAHGQKRPSMRQTAAVTAQHRRLLDAHLACL